MSIYNMNGNILSTAYDSTGNTVTKAYNADGGVVWADRTVSATEILNWLELATDDTNDGKRVKERYRMDTNAWVTVYRPDCNIETAAALLSAYQKNGDSNYLSLARNIIQSICLLQNNDGSFPFSHVRSTKYTNDNSEVIIFLVRSAEIDTDNATTYISTALSVADWLITTQNNDGSFPVSDENATKTALFTGHGVSALSTVYQYGDATQKVNYQTAIEIGLSFIATQILTGGRIKCCYEVNSNTEFWRAPSSDQCVSIRAYALAEYYLPTNANVATWEATRAQLVGYLDSLIADVGAVRNGLGTGINGADIFYYTDHIYTTAFGIEAYYWSYMATGTESYFETANKIIDFCASNVYYSETQEEDGVIRGAYNLRDKNWDTHELTVDQNVQVGANQIYSGWANAPIACWLLLGGTLT